MQQERKLCDECKKPMLLKGEASLGSISIYDFCRCPKPIDPDFFKGFSQGMDELGVSNNGNDPLEAAYLAKCQEFKNFHRVICEATGYWHDDTDWIRDQASLVNHIVAIQAKLKAYEAALEKLLNKVNVVTSYYRHGQKLNSEMLEDLSVRQIETEQAIQALKTGKGEKE